MAIKLSQELKQVQKLSPLQMQTIKLIELPIMDMRQQIRRMVEDNFVLDESVKVEEEDSEQPSQDVSLSDYKDDNVPFYNYYVNNRGKDAPESFGNDFSVKESFTDSLRDQLGCRNLSEQDKAVVNGAMLYDRAQMQPLFMLQVGHPGSSFAVEIARKIGIPEEVIAYATDLVGKDYVMSDKYLQDIVRDKMYWETKRRNIRQREKQLEDTQERYEREMTELQQERRGILAQAKADAQQLLEQSNAQIENTIRTIREAQAEKAATRQARAELADFREKLEQDTDEQDRIARKIAKIQRRRQRKEEGGETARQRNMQAEATAAAALRGKVAGKGNAAPGMGRQKDDAFGVGDTVRIKGQTVVGTIKELTGSSARVLFGMMYSQVALKKLEHAEMPQQPEGVGPAATFVSKQTRDMMYEKKLHFKPEIDIRGMHVDEALNAIAYFIDDSR